MLRRESMTHCGGVPVSHHPYANPSIVRQYYLSEELTTHPTYCMPTSSTMIPLMSHRRLMNPRRGAFPSSSINSLGGSMSRWRGAFTLLSFVSSCTTCPASGQTQKQPEQQQAGAGAEAEYTQPPNTPPQLTAKDKGKEKESNPDAASAEDTDRASIPSPEPQLDASASHTTQQFRNRIDHIRQVITRRRNGSSTSEYDHVEVTHVAYGHIDDLVATCEDYPDDDERSLCRAIFDLICYCGRGRYVEN